MDADPLANVVSPNVLYVGGDLLYDVLLAIRKGWTPKELEQTAHVAAHDLFTASRMVEGDDELYLTYLKETARDIERDAREKGERCQHQRT